MLSEEALILIALLAATGVLALGVLELVWPSAPRTPDRRSRPPLPRARSPFEDLLQPRDARARVEPSSDVAGDPPAVSSGAAAAAPRSDVVPEPTTADVGTPRPHVETSPAHVDTAAANFETTQAPVEPSPTPVETSPSRVETSEARVDASPAHVETAQARTETSPPDIEKPPLSVETTGRTVGDDVRQSQTDSARSAPADARVEPRRRRQIRSAASAPVRAAEPEGSSSAPPQAGEGDASPTARSREADAREPAPPVRREPRPHVLPIEACVSMFDEGRYAEVISLGSAALEVHDQFGRISDRVGEAALTALVGRAKEQLGDRDGARAAYAAALRAADSSLRPTYVTHVVALANTVLGEASPGAAQVRELLETSASLDDALGVAPGDASLERARTAVRDALATACEGLVATIVAGEGDRDARAVVIRALADDSMPADWRQRLGEQLTPISSAEIGQLTAQAIRCVQEGRDGDAVDVLERADRLFAALPPGTVPDERLEEFERRLWWGYTKVGLSRIDVGRFEDAMDPLFRALHLTGIDEQRLAETRSALAGALDAMIDEQARLLAVRGVQSVDVADVEKLSALARTTVERGVSEDELADALAKLETLKQALSQSGRP